MSIESYPSPNGVLTSLIWRKTAAGGETSLSGYDNASQALSYTPGQEQVYLNGILLVRGADYTATNGTSITGLTALTVDDFVQINCYNNFSVASLPAASITGTVSNAQLQNSSITINGSAVSLGGSVSLPGDIESVTASSPLTGGGSTGALTIGIQSASTSQSGAVQLSDSTSTTSSVLAATPTAVKSAYDLANGAIPKTLTTTTGDIIYASGANTPARLGIGSTGNILTVSGGVPSWAAPAASGGMTLLSTTTLSGASVSLSGITSTYKALVIYIQGFQASGSATMQMRFNGVSLTVYENRLFSNTSTTSATPTATSINVMPTSDATYGFYSQGQIVIPQYYPSVTTQGIRKMAIINSTSETGSQNYNILNGVGYFQRDGHGDIYDVTLFPSSGTFSAGKILLYGVN
jgi:hypothetical protein